MVPVGGLFLGNQDGSVHHSVLLRGPVSGNPEVAGHAADALAHVSHFALLGNAGRAKLLPRLAEGPGWGGAPRWADSTWLLGPERFTCSGGPRVLPWIFERPP